MKRTMILATMTAALTSCSGIPTEVNDQTFEMYAQGRYAPADQARFADCLFDGWDSILNHAAPSQARVTKRADGVRVDSISLTNKLILADLKDSGAFSISRMKVRMSVTTLEREMAVAGACVNRFGRGT